MLNFKEINYKFIRFYKTKRAFKKTKKAKHNKPKLKQEQKQKQKQKQKYNTYMNTKAS